MAKKYNGDLITALAKNLIGAQGDPYQQAANKFGATPIYGEDGSGIGFDWGDADVSDAQMLQADALQNKLAGIQDISNGVSLPQLGQIGMGAIKAHPFKTAGLVGLGMGNLGGLTDNNRFGGQIGGLALGGLGSYMAGDALGPYGKLMLTLGGGQLGSLFDKLRAKKEQPQQYYGGR